MDPLCGPEGDHLHRAKRELDQVRDFMTFPFPHTEKTMWGGICKVRITTILASHAKVSSTGVASQQLKYPCNLDSGGREGRPIWSRPKKVVEEYENVSTPRLT
ncbi:MAG: hypothetical protein AAB345_00775 [Patescibacteria group bacterium]